MNEILQSSLPDDVAQAHRALPGVGPIATRDWLVADDAFAAQMGERARLLQSHRGDVLAMLPQAQEAAQNLLSYVLDWLAAYAPRYAIGATQVTRPDGVRVTIERSDPLATLGHLVQEDFCLMQKQGDEHVLTGAVLCFPASWRLADKIGRPLRAIHTPVPEYDTPLAKRVQRLFDGVQVDRPLRRFNWLQYADATLHQPRSEVDPRRVDTGPDLPYTRSEQQSILRLPNSQTAVFSIHTYVVKRHGED